MDEFRLSVIVPVYNAEKYMEQCVRSILSQKMDSIEVILIDDGSTDTSGELCDKFADENAHVRVIHQENKGVLYCRKKGVAAAKAEYITFVDSDDWIEDKMFDEFLHIINHEEDIDLAVSGLICEKGSLCFKKSGSILPGIYDAEDHIAERMLYDWNTGEMGIPGYACGKLFRKSLLLEVMSGIDGNIVHGEDYAWFYTYVPLAKRIMIVDAFYYHYRMHSNSTSTSFDLSSFTQLLALKDYLDGQIEKQHISKKNIAGINQLVWGGIMHGLREIYGLSVGYLFPYELVKAGSNVVIYGAGVVGRCYYNCLKSGTYAHVTAVVDKNNLNITDFDCKIYSPKDISGFSYDVIVIAVEPEELYESIKKELQILGVEAEKIIWSKPKILRT
ncbi:glycosyltransferase [Lachnospiraceae bacterium 62-35]